MKKFLILLFEIFISISLIAQDEFYFRRYSIEQGLSQISCNAILQDSKGFIWIATQDGLNRFDGYNFNVLKHKPGDPSTISDNFIWSLAEDDHHNLWIGTFTSGVDVFDMQKGVFAKYKYDPNDSSSISNNKIWSILKDNKGNIWIGTDHGLNLFNKNNNSYTRFYHNSNNENSLSDNHIFSLINNPDGKIWVGTMKGVNLFDPETGIFQRISHNANVENTLVDNRINTLYLENNSVLWIGTKGGLSKYNVNTKKYVNYSNNHNKSNSLSHNDVRAVLRDQSGKLWVGTWVGGLELLDENNNTFNHIKNDPQNLNSLSNNQIQSLFEDHSGNLWVGTWTGGLNLYNSNRRQFYHVKQDPQNSNSLNSNTILSIAKDKNENLWIGTLGGGLNFYNQLNKEFRHYKYNPKNKNTIANNAVLALLINDNGKIWIGTNNGLDLFDPIENKFIHFKNNPKNINSVTSNRIRRLLKSKDDKLWIGTFKGLDLYNPETNEFKHYVHNPSNEHSLSHNVVLSMLRDKKGRMWVGTSGGLSLYNEKNDNFTNYKNNPNDPESLSNNSVNNISEDSKGNLWIASYGGGINYFNTKTGLTKRFRQSEGVIPTDGCSCVLSDNNGFKWISTVNGFLRYNPESNEVYRYDEQDGLQGAGFNVGVCYKAADGSMYFGGINGFNYFHPDSIKQSNYKPQVRLTQFQLFNKKVPLLAQVPKDKKQSFIFTLPQEISYINELSLPYNAYVMSFEFASLDFTLSERNNYKYKLEGFDSDWNLIGNQRKATYTNLSPGDYTLKIKGTNNDGVWSENQIKLPITIIPPWWLSWQAKLFYWVLAVIFVYGFVWSQRNKVKEARAVAKKLQKVDKLKDEFLANTSHELKTPLNGIIGLTESLIDGAKGTLSNELKSDLLMITSSGKRLSNLVNDILDYSKIKNRDLSLQLKSVDIYSIAHVVLAISKPLISGKEIKLINKIDKELPLVKADENRMQQILLNLVGNAIKFSEKGEIIVSSTLKPQYLAITVSDQGIGIPKEKFKTIFKSFEQADGSISREYEGTGLGLTITKKIVELHRGEIYVESELGKGSKFTFTIPFGKDDLIQKEQLKIEDETQIDFNPVFEEEEVIEIEKSVIDDFVLKEGLKVLIVDDEPINLQVLNNHLSLQNYKVTQVTNGEQALEILLEEKGERAFDLVILDVMMPKMSGYEVCEKIRKTFPSNQLPVILLTAKNQILDMISGFNVGANDYLTKPISKHELLTRIKTHVSLLNANRELENYSKSLEIKVKERTVELNNKKEALEKAYDKLTLLNEIGQDITANLAISKVIKTAYEKINSLMDAPEFGIGLFNKKDQKIAFNEYIFEGEKMPTVEVLMEDENRFSVHCIKNDQEIILGNVYKEYKKYITSLDSYNQNELLSSLICIPLKFKNDVIGLITVQSRNENAYSEPHLNLLRNLGLYISIAIENATTFAKLQDSYTQLKELDKFKEAMTVMIIHDFKNDLNTVINFAEGYPSERRLKSIKQAGLHMLTMALNMLDVQKFEETNVRLSISNDSISKVIQEAIKQISFLILQKSIKLSYELKSNLFSEFDFELISRVVVNLLINAIKYTPVNGEIKIISEIKNGQIKISVLDTGEGIPSDKLDFIFEKFSQVKEKASSEMRSTGLGLTFCKMVVEAHQGAIGVESEEGKGSLFWFTLPKTEAYLDEGKESIISIEEAKEINFDLTENDKILLKPYLQKIKIWNVYDYSEINDIIGGINHNGNPTISHWIDAMQNALLNGNDVKFKELIEI